MDNPQDWVTRLKALRDQLPEATAEYVILSVFIAAILYNSGGQPELLKKFYSFAAQMTKEAVQDDPEMRRATKANLN